MPRGVYVHEPSGVEECFTCAPDGGGWRYSARRSDGGTIELVADGRWRPARLQITAGEHVLRGGAAGPELLWVTAGREHAARAAGFLGESPGLLVAVARSLRLTAGDQADVRLVRVGGPVLSALTVTQRWRLAEVVAYETETEPLPVARYEVADLDTGETQAVHLAGDVVVAAPGVELTDLDSPPNLTLH